MQQRNLILVPAMSALVFVPASASSAHSTSCIAKPNGQVPPGQHWYYRTDRVTSRQCWYIGPQNFNAQKSATKQPSDTRTLPVASPHAKRLATTAPPVAHAADAAEPDVVLPAAPVLAEPAKSPDVPPSQPTLVETPRSADATGPLASATNDAAESQSPVNAQTSHIGAAAQAEVGRPSSLIVVTLALLAMVGPVFHAARWLRRRNASDRQGLGQVACAFTPESDSEPAERYIPPTKPLKQAEKEVALALQQLLNDTHTKSNVEPFQQTEQIAHELQQLLNEAQKKQDTQPRGQTEQLTEALNILRGRVGTQVELHNGQPTSATDEPIRSRDLLLANQRN
jgi:hypothetical protein